MMKKICPICDQVMSGSHYCRSCRRWIKRPNVINADYYLNERHPRREENCEYHNPSFARENVRSAPVKRSGGQPPKPNRPSQHHPNEREKTMQRYGQDQKNPAFSALIVIFAALFLLVMLSFILPFLLYFL